MVKSLGSNLVFCCSSVRVSSLSERDLGTPFTKEHHVPSMSLHVGSLPSFATQDAGDQASDQGEDGVQGLPRGHRQGRAGPVG